MPITVFTGWRMVTPGKCDICGFNDAWESDGRGTIYCSCNTCPSCGGFESHEANCPETQLAEEI